MFPAIISPSFFAFLFLLAQVSQSPLVLAHLNFPFLSTPFHLHRDIPHVETPRNYSTGWRNATNNPTHLHLPYFARFQIQRALPHSSKIYQWIKRSRLEKSPPSPSSTKPLYWRFRFVTRTMNSISFPLHQLYLCCHHMRFFPRPLQIHSSFQKIINHLSSNLEPA